MFSLAGDMIVDTVVAKNVHHGSYGPAAPLKAL